MRLLLAIGCGLIVAACGLSQGIDLPSSEDSASDGGFGTGAGGTAAAAGGATTSTGGASINDSPVGAGGAADEYSADSYPGTQSVGGLGGAAQNEEDEP